MDTMTIASAADTAVTVDAADLRRAVQQLARVVARRSTIPILSHVLIETMSRGMRLTGTDMDTRLEVLVPLDAPGRGRITARVPVHPLERLLREIGAGSVSLSAGSKVGIVDTLAVQHDAFAAQIPCLPVDDFPTADSFAAKDAVPFFLRAGELAELLHRVEHCISREETRYYLNGIALRMKRTDGTAHLVAAATDGHRLAEANVEVPAEPRYGALEAGPLILPRAAVATLLRLLATMDPTAPIAIACGALNMEVGGPTWRMQAKLIDGTYPDYERAIPAEFTYRAEVDRLALRRAVRLVTAITSEKGIRSVKLTFVGTRLVIKSRDHDGGDAVAAIPTVFRRASGSAEDRPFEIGFNGGYLTGLLDHAEGDVVTLSFTDPTGPMLMTVTGATAGARQVLMPMRV